jgi:hypothetical protein
VAEGWQGRGIATLLLAQLAEAAAAEGVRHFTAVVLAGNHRMIRTFRDSGFPVEVHTQPGELEVTFPTTLTEDGRRRFEERERTAAVAAVEHVLQPVRRRRRRVAAPRQRRRGGHGQPRRRRLHRPDPRIRLELASARPPAGAQNRCGRGELRRGRRTACGWKASSTAL